MISTNVLEKAALMSRHSRSKHAAMVVKGGSVLAVAKNKKGRHAEMAVIRKVSRKKLSGSVVITLRVLSQGDLGLGRPCDDCMKQLVDSGVKAVIYSDKYGRMVKEVINGPRIRD